MDFGLNVRNENFPVSVTTRKKMFFCFVNRKANPESSFGSINSDESRKNKRNLIGTVVEQKIENESIESLDKIQMKLKRKEKKPIIYTTL